LHAGEVPVVTHLAVGGGEHADQPFWRTRGCERGLASSSPSQAAGRPELGRSCPHPIPAMTAIRVAQAPFLGREGLGGFPGPQSIIVRMKPPRLVTA
jgi:hypothetical protein